MNSEPNLNEQTLKGGRGQCSLCGEWHNNVSYHEAHECVPSDDGDTTPTEQFAKRMERVMERVIALPPPTMEEVETHLSASAAHRKYMKDVFDGVREVSQDEFVKTFTQR